MLEFKAPWALFMLLAPGIVRVLTPEFRDSGKSVRAPFFSRLIRLTGKTPTQGTVLLTKGALRRIPQRGAVRNSRWLAEASSMPGVPSGSVSCSNRSL